MRRTLAIVERAHRGTVEQQYAHVLWLVHALHRQSPMTVLLRGPAAVYALDTPPPRPPRLGNVAWGAFPDYRDALGRLRADGAIAFVCLASLHDLGLGERPLCPDVQTLTIDDITAMVIEHRRVWFL